MNKSTMLGYIDDQPRALCSTYNQKELYCNPFLKIFQNNDIRKIYILGSGTSYHASLAFKFYFEKYLPVEVSVMIPTQFTNYETLNNNKMYDMSQILVIGISQSGTSVSTIEAIRKAHTQGYTTIAITDALNSLITKETPNVIKLTCGKEEIPIETRGYSVTVFQSYITVIELAHKLNYLTEKEYLSIQKGIQKTLKLYPNIINQTKEWYKKNKNELLALEHGHISSYGLNTCTSLEGVLKLYETFKKPLSAYDLEELIHGPQMAFNDKTYIFIVASKEVEFDRIPLFQKFFYENQITEHLFFITNQRISYSKKDCILNADILEDLSPLIYTLPFQIIAALNCISSGIDTSVRPAQRKSFAHIYQEDIK